MISSVFLDKDVPSEEVRGVGIKPRNGYKVFVMGCACYHFLLDRMRGNLIGILCNYFVLNSFRKDSGGVSFRG